MFYSQLLTYLVGGKDQSLLLKDISVRRRIVTIIVTAIKNYDDDEILMRSALKILTQLEIPKDIVSINLVFSINIRFQ